jgi:hypothetical protein
MNPSKPRLASDSCGISTLQQLRDAIRSYEEELYAQNH